MGKNNFRENRLKNSRGGTGFLKVFALTVIIVSAAFLINLTVPSDKTDSTSPPTESSVSDASASETSAAVSSASASSQDTAIQTTSEAATTSITVTAATTATETTVLTPPIISDEEINALISIQYLTINPYSRVGLKRSGTECIVIHYVANAGTSAANNWSYFNGLAYQKTGKGATSASSNFIIGLYGEIIQCMPIDEIAYANYPKNEVSISIECCHPDSDGKFSEATYNSLVKLVSWLCQKYGLGEASVIRHYDVSGKRCPLYWAGEPGSAEYKRWIAFKKDLMISR